MILQPRAGWSPLLSPSGQWCAYNADATVHLVTLDTGEEQTLAPLGRERAAYPCGWWGATQLAYLASYRDDRKGPFDLRVYDVATRVVTTLAPLPIAWLDGVRAVAARGHWAAGCGTAVVVDGVVWSEHLHWRIAFDGHLLAVRTSQGIEVWQMAGGVGMPRTIYVPAPGAVVMDIQLCDPYLGYGYGQCRLLDMATGVDVDAHINPRPEGESAPQVVDGWVWSFRERPTPMVLGRPVGETACIQLPVPESCVFLHVRRHGAEWLLATNGDRGQVCIQSVSVDAPRRPLVTGPPILPPAAPVPEYPRLQHPALIGGFFVGCYWPDGQNACREVFGNCAVIAGDARAAETLDPCGTAPDAPFRWRVITLDAIPGMAKRADQWATVAAIYIAPEGADNFEAGILRERAAARYLMSLYNVPPRPVIVYTAGDLAMLHRLAHDADGVTWPGVQLYLQGAQGPDDLRLLMAEADAVLAGLPIVQIAQGYDRNATYTGDLAALVPVYQYHAALLGAQHKGTLVFSYKRAGGIRDLVQSGRCPTLHAQWQAFARAVPRPQGAP